MSLKVLIGGVVRLAMAELVAFRKNGEVSVDGLDGRVTLSLDGELSSDGEGFNDEDKLVSEHLREVKRENMPLRKKLCFLLIVALVSATLITVALITANKGSCHSHNSEEQGPWTQVRLPSNVQPLLYEVDLHPNLTTFDVSGNVTVQVQISSSSTKYIILHIKEMRIVSTSVRRESGAGVSELKIARTFNYTKNDFFIVEMASDLSPGLVNVSLSWTSVLSKSLVGFYRSEYQPAGSMEKRCVGCAPSTYKICINA